MFSRTTLAVIATTIVSLLIGVVIATIAVQLVLSTDFADRLKSNYIHELFARAAITVAMIGFVIAIIRGPNIEKRSEFSVPIHIILATFVLGVFISLLDPFSQIRNELNVIRYPTAIALTLAGAFLLFTAAIKPRHILFRVLAAALGVLLVLAAGAELLELHEDITVADDTALSRATGVTTQDFLTLFVAMVGILIAFIARKVVRLFANRGLFQAGNREVAAADLFLAAGITFLAAMVLDTFDWVFTGTAHSALSLILAADNSLLIGQTLNGYYETLANSLEEFLEFGAAMLLLSTAIAYKSETEPLQGKANDPSRPFNASLAAE